MGLFSQGGWSPPSLETVRSEQRAGALRFKQRGCCLSTFLLVAQCRNQVRRGPVACVSVTEEARSPHLNVDREV